MHTNWCLSYLKKKKDMLILNIFFSPKTQTQGHLICLYSIPLHWNAITFFSTNTRDGMEGTDSCFDRFHNGCT